MRIAVMGAGGVGGYFGARLSDAQLFLAGSYQAFCWTRLVHACSWPMRSGATIPTPFERW